jgi:hypothetical protein
MHEGAADFFGGDFRIRACEYGCGLALRDFE